MGWTRFPAGRRKSHASGVRSPLDFIARAFQFLNFGYKLQNACIGVEFFLLQGKP